MSFYNLVVPFIYWLKAYGYFTTLNIISFLLIEYRQGATNASNNKIPVRILQPYKVNTYENIFIAGGGRHD